jgi:hypothetical protein
MKVLKINEKTTPGTATTATVDVDGKVQELAAAEGGEGAYRHFTIYGLAVRYRPDRRYGRARRSTGRRLGTSTTYWEPRIIAADAVSAFRS